MYAIVRTGGKQYRVEKGQRLLVERMTAEQGSEVALEPLMLRSEETVLDKQALGSVKVTAKVLAHVRGEKLRVFKFKPKRGYRRRTGHRQDLTQIEVTGIARGKAKAAAKPAAAKPAAADAQASEPAPSKPAAQARSARPASAKPGGGVGIGKDDTLYARAAGIVEFKDGRRGRVVNVLPASETD